MDWDIITRFVLPPLLGGICGFAASWLNWGIEKRRQRLQRKRELVTGWRMQLIPMLGQLSDTSQVWAGERQRRVMTSPYYASLRPHLSEAARAEIEDATLTVFVERGGKRSNDWNHHFPLKIFVEEIARIEREWKLV